MHVIDLFAGPGGWDVAAIGLDLHPLGIEWDDAACATRAAAGLRTLQADVAELDPREVMAEHFGRPESVRGFHPLDGLIASPPCQAFSMAGKGEGRKALGELSKAARVMGNGARIDVEALDRACEDERAHLVLEPLRWALALKPRWIAFEQVKPVLPLWEVFAEVLRDAGYSTWTGILSAERYGVPQTRERAILIASLDRKVEMPPPTHQRYVPPRRRDEETLGLFDAPEPERIVPPEDRHLLPWRSMAEALGWCEEVAIDHHRGAGMIERHGERTDRTTSQPAPTVTAGGGRWEGGPRWTLRDDPRQWLYRNGNQDNASERALDEPAPTIAFGHNAARIQWVVRTGANSMKHSRDVEDIVPFERSVDAPAPTLDSKVGSAWKVVPEYDSRGQRDGKSGELNRRRGIDEPAPTIAGESRNDAWVPPSHFVVDQNGSQPRAVEDPAPTITATGAAKGRERWTHERPAPTVVTTRRSDEGMIIGRQLPPGEGRNIGGHGWTEDRPATTVNGDSRISEPGHHDAAVSGSQQLNAVRVSPQEASVLQSFPVNYPWHGTKTKQFEQIGNAVPPLLALRVLEAVVS